MRDLLSNVVCGIQILIYRPYVFDDMVTVQDIQGTVTSIDLRYTELTRGGERILVPNSLMVTSTIVVARGMD